MQEQVEVEPRSCRTTLALRSVSALGTQVGMNPFCQEHSFVSGWRKLISFSCDPRRKYGFGVRGTQSTRHRILTPHQCLVERLGPLLVCIYLPISVTLTRLSIQHCCYIRNRCCVVCCLRLLCTLSGSANSFLLALVSHY